MNQLPSALITSLQHLPGFDQAAFERVHASGPGLTSIRINPGKLHPGDTPSVLANAENIPWSQYGYYLSQRPSFTFDPLFHAGAYYVQEASSMFLEQALLQASAIGQPLKVLDLCAAPGGKSTHLQSLLSPGSLLVSNEVIRTRAAILKDNIQKWGADNVVVTNNDPTDFSRLPGFFDVIVADAPCSGSGLFRKDPEAINEWSESNVALCSQRQQRILADVWPALKEGGLLIYATCSYSEAEDEMISNWIQQELGGVYLPLSIHGEWQVTDTGAGYRFWPYKVRGEGFFIACFQKQKATDDKQLKIKQSPLLLSRAEKETVSRWVTPGDYYWLRHEQTVYAWPLVLADDMNRLLQLMHVQYSGTRIGELIREKLVPDHALAMSITLRNGSIPAINAGYDDAIRFLQRRDMQIHSDQKGWNLLNYQGYPLGWINVLQGRINNYYPKSLRILKDSE